MTTIATALKFLLLSLAAWAVAFAVRQTFVPNIVPIAWADEPQPLWAVEVAFLLRAVEGLSYAEIAAMLGRPVQLVKSSYRAVWEALRRRFFDGNGSQAPDARIDQHHESRGG